ncbi:MAG: XrtA/PEP-CTERM system TPR-repeat protein PrsT [Gammaproteobacteria bacterium]
MLGLLLALAPPAFAAIDRGASELYEHALQLREENDAVVAIIELKSALQADPAHLSSQLLIGEIYLDQGLGAAAEEALRTALKRGADGNAVMPMLAKAMLKQGKFAKVVSEMSVEGLAPENAASVHTTRAQAFLAQRLRAKAERELDKALTLMPRGLEPNLVRVSALMQAGEMGEAERAAKSLVQEHPTEPDAWLAVSAVAQVSGRHQEALDGYTRALEVKPTHLTARLSRIALLIDLGRDGDAKTDFDYLEREFAKDPRASYMRAVWLARTPDGKGTTEALQQVLDVVKKLNDRAFAEDPALNLMTGMSYYGLGDFQQASTRLQSYIKQQPGDLGARKALADTLLRLGDAAQAANVLEPAVEANPRDTKAVSLLATAYAKTQRFRQADHLLEQAIGLGGRNEELAPQLAMLQLSTGNFRDGLPALDRHFDEDPDNGQIGVPLVAAYLNANDTRRALETAERLRQSAPKNPVYVNLLGVAHFMAGSLDEAGKLFAQALALAPRFTPAQINLAKLELRQGKIEAANGRLAALLKAKPDDPKLMIEMSRAALAAGKEREALKLAEDAYRKAPKNRAALFHLFDMRMAVGKLEPALDLILTAEGDYQGDFDVLSRHAALLVRMGKLEQLRPLLKKMADAATQQSDNLLRTAQLQVDFGFLGDADYTISKIFQNDPRHERAGLMGVQVALQKEDAPEALRRSAEVLTNWPESPAAHMMRGEALLLAGDPRVALASFDEVLKREPASPAVVRGYHALLAADDAAGARERLVRWLADHPEDFEVKNTLAEDHLRAGEFEAANRVLEELLAARPNDPRLLNNLANTRFRLGQADAVDAARAALKLAPEDPLINDTLGWLLVSTGQAEEGLAYLRSASARMAENPEIRFHLAVCLNRIGRQTEAKKELDKALRTGEDFEGRAAALDLQKTLLGLAEAPAVK